MSESETRSDLARLGVALEDDGTLWRLTLRALGSPPGGSEPLSPRHLEMVAGQVHANVERDDAPVVELAEDYAKTFVAVYGLTDLGDVDDLLGREQHERDNYEGRLALERDRSEDEIVESILEG
jgi:hypothetical protein